jgi:AAA domain
MNGLDLIRAENPLLKPLGDYIELEAWPGVLLNDPLEKVDRHELTQHERRMLLKQSRMRFEPTDGSISIVSRIQDMLWARLTFGNPLLPENRFRTVQVLAQRGKQLADAPWLPDYADALMVMGCTAIGKTTAIKRYVGQIKQVYVHPPREDAEWTRHIQVTYLIVPMPVHRGGLLYAILAGIDLAIGTNYRAQYADHRRWPIEKLAIEVGIILVQHSVGVLIIEEIQARNFSMSPNREEMLLFILRLLNFGVPVVLVGNPLGFVGLDEFSQDINRLTENEPIHLMPAVVDDDEWRTGLGPGMWSHNVMPKVTRWSPAVCKELHACSAAFPGYVRKACDGAQLLAMESGATAVDLSHLVLYREKSSTYAMNSDLIEGFADKNPYKLMKYLDVPWEQYGLLWGKISLEEIAHGRDQGELTTDKNIDEEGKAAYRSVHDRIRSQAAARISQTAKKASRTASTSEAGAKTKASLSAGLQALRQKLENEKPKPDSA